MAKRIRGRALLKRWRQEQDPPISQDEVGGWLPSNRGNRRGKCGRAIGLWESGKAELSIGDRMILSARTGIPLSDLLAKSEASYIAEASEMLARHDDAA